MALTHKRRLALGTASVAAAAVLMATAAAAPASAGGSGHPGGSGGSGKAKTVDLQILSFNDYHGNLEAPAGTNGQLPIAGADGAVANKDGYGGAAALSAKLAALRKGHKNTLTVAAGDLIGASPVVSGLFHDEPSIATLNAMKLDVSSVGNHEFDEGINELLRMQYGGCRADDGCYANTPFKGAAFQYLAANVTWKNGVKVPSKLDNGTRLKGYGSWFKARTGRTVLPPTSIEKVNGIPVGFIGMTLEATPELVAQEGIKNLNFRDEVVTANLAAADLRRKGVRAIVVLVHEGGLPPTGAAYDFKCDQGSTSSSISGPIVDIAKKLDSSIDMVISGHTHQPYTCTIPDPSGQPRKVTSAMSYGRLVTDTNLKLDRRTGDVVRSSVTAVNKPVLAADGTDPKVASIVSKWSAAAAPLANRVVGQITGDITRSGGSADNRGAESSLGNLIADSQLDRTKVNGAQIAFMNSGGLRTDLVYASSPAGEGNGNVTYGEAFAVQPFANTLVTMTLTGAQIDTALEQQFQAGRSRPVLINGPSRGFTYSYSASAAEGSKVDPASIKLDGVTVDPNGSYRVTVNSFLADGGDGFTVFRSGTNRVGGGVDLDEFVAWLGANSPAAPPAVTRITVLP